MRRRGKKAKSCYHCLMKSIRLLAFLAAFPCLWAPSAPATAASAKPNIIFILADDIGYGDLGCYGAKLVKTPHCDQLAREGVRFTDAHATGSTCTPTRYAFITGQYAWRNPLGAGILSGEAPLAMDPAKPTTPSVLKQAGYRTGLVGKWHIGLGKGDLDYNKEIKPGPVELGFDYAFFFPATGDRVPCVFIENHRVVGLDPDDPIRTSYAHKIGDEPTGKENPELLKMKPSYGHNNTIINGISRIGWMSGGKSARWVDELMADTLTKKAVGFIEQNKDKPFFLYLATQDIHVPRVPGNAYRGKSGCGIRGDVIEEFDGTVGAVLDTLNHLQLADNTLVIVTSDNGGVMDDGYQDGSGSDTSGHRCNGPLRGYKGSLWEGGHREPFLARWPGHIKPGTTSGELIGLVDMMATFAAVAGVEMPKNGGPDSFNVLSALLGGKSPRNHLVVQSNGIERQAIRVGTWEYIPGTPGARAGAAGSGKYSTNADSQLYNLSDDLAEQHNLAGKEPGKVKEFQALLDKIKADGRSAP
jgi:arylsulfatase A-like enzyme